MKKKKTPHGVDRYIHREIFKYKSRVLPYCGDIRLAMSVKQHLLDNGFCCFQLDSDHHYCTEATFLHSESKHRKKDRITGWSDALENQEAHAICLAAVKAWESRTARSPRFPSRSPKRSVRS